MLINKIGYNPINFNNKNNIDIRKQSSQDDTTSYKEEKKRSNVLAYAFAGAVLPVIFINVAKKGNVQSIADTFKNNKPITDKFKSLWKLFEIENYWQILATTTGGVSGGLVAGLRNSNTSKEREAKYKEGIFEFLNNMTPTTLVAMGSHYLNKKGKGNSIPLKVGLIISSVAGGMYIANKASNKIYQTTFDKNKKEEDRTKRNFKISDTFVHVDDLISVAVLTKIPYADKLQIDKLLPLIYTKSGYEVATAEN